MTPIREIQTLSLYAGQATFDELDDPWQEGSKPRKSARSNLATGRLLAPVLRKTFSYIQEDDCRSAFLLCIVVVVIAAVLYYAGHVEKMKMQRYLIELESGLAQKRQIESLLRNLNGLETLLRSPAASPRAASTDVREYLENIRHYFQGSELNMFERFYRGKVDTLETALEQEQIASFNGTTGTYLVTERAGSGAGNTSYVLNALKWFAFNEYTRIRRNAEILEQDARRTLVGKVAWYNGMLEFSMLIGLAFFITGIACIPGLGRFRRTGFV